MQKAVEAKKAAEAALEERSSEAERQAGKALSTVGGSDGGEGLAEELRVRAATLEREKEALEHSMGELKEQHKQVTSPAIRVVVCGHRLCGEWQVAERGLGLAG